ncbi:MAG: hypothetical protein WA160_03165 [Pseudobdellovibrio sp.]
MTYVKAKPNWDEVFIQEAIDLEEKMNSLDSKDLNQSRLRICLESKILDWNKYQNWMRLELNCSCLKQVINQKDLKKLINKSLATFESFSNFDMWNEDLIPIDVWDDNLIVLGLEYNEKLIEIPKCIFILATPEILSSFAERLFAKSEQESESNKISEESEAEIDSMLDGIDINIAAPSLKFNSDELLLNYGKDVPATDSNAAIWDYITERHEEYCFEAKKQFNAYVVLKIEKNLTLPFKMDSELMKQSINPKAFEYNLSEDSPFKKVLTSGASESFNINQLDYAVLDYKYACITPLKRGKETIGFLLGLKSKHLDENDQVLLEDLAKESA